MVSGDTSHCYIPKLDSLIRGCMVTQLNKYVHSIYKCAEVE